MDILALKNLIALGEGFTTEFKRSGTSNLGREICAFANATGGVIMIGVAANSSFVREPVRSKCPEMRFASFSTVKD
jgi:predicted HTH transcriptional regulator